MSALSPPGPHMNPARSRSGSRSSTSSVLSMSSFGDVSQTSAENAEIAVKAEQMPLGEVMSRPPTLSSRLPYTQFSRFFLSDKVVRFIAGDALFQVHSSVLERHSGWFRTYLSQSEYELPPGWERVHDVPGAPKGVPIFVHREHGDVSFSQPSVKDVGADAIILEDISADELEAFLAILYPQEFHNFGLNSCDDRDWTAVLKVAHRWDCSAIKALAIEHLDTILEPAAHGTSLKRLTLARRYDVDSWVESALLDLGVRDAALEEEEIAQMRPCDVRQVVLARETRWRGLVEARGVGEADEVPEEGKNADGEDDEKRQGDIDTATYEEPEVLGDEDSGRASSLQVESSPGDDSSEQSPTEKQDDALRGRITNIDATVNEIMDKLLPETLDGVAAELAVLANSSKDEDLLTIKRIAWIHARRAAKAVDAQGAELFAHLCESLSSKISDDVQSRAIDDSEMLSGWRLYYVYVLDYRATYFDTARNRCRCHAVGAEGSVECRLAQTRFFAALIKKDVLVESRVRAYIECLLSGLGAPREDEVETLCEFFKITGARLDTVDRGETMDGYIERMEAMEMKLTADEAARVRPLVDGIIELRTRGWEEL